MDKIIEKAINVNPDEFYLVEPELFQRFYTQKNKPDFITHGPGCSVRSLYTLFPIHPIDGSLL